jgi:hypothetical protein
MSVEFLSKFFIVDDSFESRNHDLEWWALYTHIFFKDTLFVSDYVINENGKNRTVLFVFNLKSRQYHTLSRETFSEFVRLNFPDKKILYKKPEFFGFSIPFPLISYPFRKDDSIIISKIPNSTFQHIVPGTIRINLTDLNLDSLLFYDDSNFRYVFQKDYQDILHFSDNFKKYMSEFLNIDAKKLNVQHLIKPFFILTKDEYPEIIALLEVAEEKYRIKAENDYQDRCSEAQAKYEDSCNDEMYRAAFEFDPENYWNVE